MELFQSRKLLIIKGQFFRSVINNARPYKLCDNNSVFCCTENCKSIHEKYIYHSPPPPPAVLTHHSHKLSTFLTGIITVIAMTIFFVCAYAVYSKYQSNRSRRANPNPSPNPNPNPSPNPNPNSSNEEREDRGAVEHHVWYIRTVGIDPAAIASITAVKYKKDESLIECTDCSVCLSEFEEDEALRLLPKCSHAFHVACIDMWLRSHTNCPMCRAPVVVIPPEQEPKLPENEGGENSAEETVVRVVEPSRRSVSLGCLDDEELEIINKLRGNNSLGKKLQRMRSGNISSSSTSSSTSSLSMRRSSSCNGKLVMCRPVRVTDSILPLRSDLISEDVC